MGYFLRRQRLSLLSLQSVIFSCILEYCVCLFPFKAPEGSFIRSAETAVVYKRDKIVAAKIDLYISVSVQDINMKAKNYINMKAKNFQNIKEKVQYA